MSYVPLSFLDLAIAAVLILLNGAISIAFRLGLERSIAVAAARMIVQLALIGLVLDFIFKATSPVWTVLFAVLMLAATGFEVATRQERRIVGWQAFALGAGPPFLAGLLATLFAVLAIIEPEPWYGPRFLLPILGMMIGNALSGVSLVLDTLTSGASRERSSIEARLALGASRFEAMGDVLRRGLRTGLMPILTAMAATGVVSLPGMMTGQILSGIEPIEAAKYQVMIMFLIAGSTGLSVVIAGIGAVLLVTDERHRLRLDRLAPVTSPS